MAYKVGVRNLPGGQSAKEFTRAQLHRLKIGGELEIIPWGTKQVKLPRSAAAGCAQRGRGEANDVPIAASRLPPA